MADIGENYVKFCFEEQGYVIEQTMSKADVFASKSNLGVVIEEKDWKDPVVVDKNKIYQLAVNGKRYRQDRAQVVDYAFKIKQQDMAKGNYRFIVAAFVFSNLQGRRVQPIFFRKYGTIFCVAKEYFPTWLKSLERTYLGMPAMETTSQYTGGK